MAMSVTWLMRQASSNECPRPIIRSRGTGAGARRAHCWARFDGRPLAEPDPARAATAANEPNRKGYPSPDPVAFCPLPWCSPIRIQTAIWTSIQQLSALALTLRGGRPPGSAPRYEADRSRSSWLLPIVMNQRKVDLSERRASQLISGG